jgi:hypothetical protein
MVFGQIIDAYTAIVLQPRFEDSRFLCPVHYSWIASNYSSVSQRVIQDLANTIFAYDKVNIVYSSMMSTEFCIQKMIKFSLPMQVFMPFQVKQQHWIVVVIMNKEEEFQILDSSWKLQDYEPEIKKLVSEYVILLNDLAWTFCEIYNL